GAVLGAPRCQRSLPKQRLSARKILLQSQKRAVGFEPRSKTEIGFARQKPATARLGWIESNAWCPRLTARIILLGSAVHVKGLGLALCSTTKRLMAACRSTTDTKTPRCNRCLVSLAKKPSTALSQEAEVGVKWKVQRGCRRSHWRTFGCLWVA